MTIRLAIYLASIFFIVFPAVSREKGGEPSSPPNVVFILLDAARADHFSCYGYDKKTTPRIDAIGQRGAIFLKNFVAATETYYSLPLIFTSRY